MSDFHVVKHEDVLIPARVHQERNLVVRASLQQILVGSLLILLCGIRLIDVQYNTLFVDEASYILVGEQVLHGRPDPQALTWMSGSYLYPILAAAVAPLGGIGGLRALSALLSTCTAALIYFSTRQLFGMKPALWSLLLYGLSGVSIFVGQLAVYEALASLLLSMAVLCLVSGRTGQRGWATLLGGSLCFALAVLVKYVLILYLPVLVLLQLALALYDNRAFGIRLLVFLVACIAIPAGYGLIYRAELQALLAGSATFQVGDAAFVWSQLWTEIGYVLVLAGLGGLLGLAHVMRQPNQPRSWRVAWFLLALLLVIALLIMPLYQAVSGNIRSASKQTVYTLLLLTPLAGVCCAWVVAWIQGLRSARMRWMQVAGILVSLLAMLAFCNAALDQVWSLQRRWPNVSATVNFLRQPAIPSDARVLAEGSQMYQYYLRDNGTKQQWLSTWSFGYGEKSGIAALQAAIHDRYFAVVVLDDYYTPGVRAQLEPALAGAGYYLAWSNSQVLSTGETIFTTVYQPGLIHPVQQPR